MKWTKHQNDCHDDPRMIKLLMKYGAEGYGVYWFIVELIGKRLDKSHTEPVLNDEIDAEFLSFLMKTDQGQIEKILETCIDLGLLQRKGKRLSCDRILKNIDDTTASAWKVLGKSSSDSVVSGRKSEKLPSNSNKLALDKIRRDKKRLDKNRKDQKRSDGSTNKGYRQFQEAKALLAKKLEVPYAKD